MADRPTEVKVGYHTLQIKWLTEKQWMKRLDPGKIGVHVWSAGRIYIRLENDTDLIVESFLRETLLHELLHSVYEFGGLAQAGLPGEKEHEEHVVGLMSPTLLTILRDNPDVSEYLLASS